MPVRGHKCRVISTLVGAAVLSIGWAAAGAIPASAAAQALDPSSCVTAPSTVVLGVQIADPACEFSGSAYTGPFGSIANAGGQQSEVWTGIASDGAAYRIEVPPQWNGTLVMYAHGFRGTGNVVWVDEPQLRQYFVDHGYAWAASSYAMNGYDPGDGVVDTHDLLEAFPSITGLHPRQAIMTGLSMGGEITTAEIEAYKGDFAGAMPSCGVLAGNDLFDYYLGANVTAAGLTGTTITYPTTLAAGTAYAPAYQTAVQSELPALGITPNPATGGHTFATDLTRTGTLWADTVEQLSGGTRPGFQSALGYWNSFGFAPLTKIPFLFGLYPGLNGGTLGFANGSVAGNERTFYTFSDQPFHMLPQEIALNRAVLRVPVTATSSADALSPAELPAIHGAIDPRDRGPVRSLFHGPALRRDDGGARRGQAVRGPGHPRGYPLRVHDQRTVGRLLRPRVLDHHGPTASWRRHPRSEGSRVTVLRLPVHRSHPRRPPGVQGPALPAEQPLIARCDRSELVIV